MNGLTEKHSRAYIHGVTPDFTRRYTMGTKIQSLTNGGLTNFETVSHLLAVVSAQINCFVTFCHIGLKFAQIYTMLTIQKKKKTIVNSFR